MSRKGRGRRERYKTIQADDYFSNGTFEIARFGKNTLLKNNCTFEQQKAHMDYLQAEYPAKYKAISEKINMLIAFRQPTSRCSQCGWVLPLTQLPKRRQSAILGDEISPYLVPC